MASIAPIKSLLPVGEQRVVFRDITWQGYQQLLEVFGDRRAAHNFRSGSFRNYYAVYLRRVMGNVSWVNIKR
jgi:hypothetical protein